MQLEEVKVNIGYQKHDKSLKGEADKGPITMRQAQNIKTAIQAADEALKWVGPILGWKNDSKLRPAKPLQELMDRHTSRHIPNTGYLKVVREDAVAEPYLQKCTSLQMK